MRYRAEKLHNMIEPVVTGLGYELVGVHRAGDRGGRGLLRVYIDAPDGVGVDDCARVSEQLSRVLDVEDPIPEAYTLEVSSPGFDRPLFTAADYRRFTGSRVRIQLVRPVGGRRRFTGDLIETSENEVLIAEDGVQHRIPLDSIDSARLAPNA